MAALAAVVIALGHAEAVARPLDRLRRAAAALARGAFDERVEAGGSREVVALVAGFNEMAERLHDTVDDLIHDRSRLEALLAAGADATLALDHGAMVRYLNPAATALFGQAIGSASRDGAQPRVERPRRRSAPQAARAPPSDRPCDRWYQARPVDHRRWGGRCSLILQDITEIRRAKPPVATSPRTSTAETPLAGIRSW
jgi:PAS domain-containing protein